MKTIGTNLRSLFAAFAVSWMVVSAFAQDTGFADELKDYGVSATKNPRPRSSNYGSATPTEIPGAKVVTTKDLITMLAGETRPVLIAAYSAPTMIPGSIAMDGAGEDRLLGVDREKFPKALTKLTSDDKSKLIVFYCHGSKCWLSYNAALHALELGYTNVMWYRGGRDAWKEANQKFVPPAGTW